MAGAVLVYVEGGDDLSAQALALARTLGPEVHAVVVGEPAPLGLDAQGVAVVHVASGAGLASYAPAAWGAAVSELVGALAPAFVVAAGSDRATEVLAHVAARLDLPLAANCIAVTPGEPLAVTRVRWGGSLLEEALVHGAPALLTVMPHAVAAEPASAPGAATVQPFSPAIDAHDLRAVVRERVAAGGGGRSLADAKVVVSGGRGVGSAEGFAVIEELADLLDAAVGCSRAVTMAGWRPHTDQVGQTGTKIAPDIYIPCGISGATQHMAGCRGAKKLLAINPDAEASIFASADYAVIGDLHEVVPAISAELRKARGA
jgi:electron transfer flavoprotein alpha subunit